MKLEELLYLDSGTVHSMLLRQNSSDTQLVGQILIDRAFDLSLLRRKDDIQKFLDNARKTGKRPLVIDAGANIGLTSIYLHTQFRDATIVAIEPEPSNFALLCHNVQDFPVLPIPCALAGTSGQVSIVDTGEGFWAFRTEAVTGSGEPGTDYVDCVMVDEIFHEHKDECFPFIVKMDIEGGEDDVFNGPVEWINQTPILIVELHDWMLPKQRTAQSFLLAIAGMDRDFVQIGENIFSIANDLDALVERQS